MLPGRPTRSSSPTLKTAWRTAVWWRPTWRWPTSATSSCVRRSRAATVSGRAVGRNLNATSPFTSSPLFHAAETNFPDSPALPVHLVQSMLKALRMNSEEARLKFPRLLQIIESYPAETMDLMTKEVRHQTRLPNRVVRRNHVITLVLSFPLR